MKTSCETECCPTAASTQTCNSSQGECLAQSDCDCPIEGATQMWSRSFGAAMCEAQTELLKAKILKAWGPMMDQAADAMIESMGACWQEKVAQVRTAEAKQAFQERLRDLWLQDKKK